MITRLLLARLAETLTHTPAVALTGPRQVGKTTLALQIAGQQPSLYLDLEKPVDAARAGELESIMRQSPGLLLLDEVQRMPEMFPLLRGIIDAERRAGRKAGLFLLLGSASMELLRQSSESLAGRIAYLELYPVNTLEWADGDLARQDILWLRGGFPESLLAATDGQSVAWRSNFITTYAERDIPQLGPRIPAATLLRFWTMLAHGQGAIFNAAQIARNMDIAGITASRYLDLMADLLLVRRLQPWTFNEGKRLIRSPKVYLRDSGIAHALLRIPDYHSLLGHPVAGGSWEGFVIENILSVAPPLTRAYYYRTGAGAEIDLLLELSPAERWAIEIKRSTAPKISKGFYTACDDIAASRRYVVYNGGHTFPLGHGAEAISLAGLMRLLLAAY